MRILIIISLCVIVHQPMVSCGFEDGTISPLIEDSCIECHDGSTKTPLNFEELSFDLSDSQVFRTWEKIFDQVESGEMPPAKRPRPDRSQKKAALDSLAASLRDFSLSRQGKNGRVPLRRMTATEYHFTLHDLLGIGGDLVSKLPPESDLSVFDTIARGQGVSPVHIRGWLAAADAALDEAIQLGRRPRQEAIEIDDNTPLCNLFVRMLQEMGLETDAFATSSGVLSW